MKRIAIVLLAATCLLAGCSRGQKFTVQGTLRDIGFKGATAVKVEYEMIEEPLEAPVTDDAFKVEGRVKKPIIAKIQAIGTEKRMIRMFILEKGDITFERGYAVGTPLNDSTVAFIHRISDLAKKYSGQKEPQVKAIEEEFTSFITRHADDPCAIWALKFGHHKVRRDLLRELIGVTSPEIRNDGEVRALDKELRLPF